MIQYVFFCNSMLNFMQRYYFLWLILSIVSLVVQMYNSVLSWYQLFFRNQAIKSKSLFKKDTVLYLMIKYVFLQEYAKKNSKNIKVEA